MNAPRRLLEDPEIAEALRADLQAVVDHRLGYDVAAGLARFEASLATTAATGGVGSSLALKLGIAGLVAGGVAVFALSGGEPNRAPSVTLPTSQEGPSIANTSRAPTALPPAPVAPSAPETPALDSVEPPTEPVTRQPSRALSPTPRQKAPESRDDLLAREIEQLRQIRRTLGSNPQRALELANTGHVEFRRGVLYQEREALALQALSALGRSQELERRGRRYLEAFPNGSFSDRVQKLLGR